MGMANWQVNAARNTCFLCTCSSSFLRRIAPAFISSLYSKLRTSPLDTGLEQGYTCSIQLLNAPGKVCFFHPARPIQKARTSLAPFLSRTDDERVALRAPQYKGSRAQEPFVQRGALLMWYAGIDWANDHHDAVVIDEKGHQVGSLRIDHSPQGMSRLHTFLAQIIGSQSKEQMACIIETTHGLLIAHLLEAGWPVYPVNPRTVDRRRSASGAKTDTIDAYLLAKTGRADLADLHRLTPDNEKIAELKLLTWDQDALSRMQTRLVNQLTACLKAYYPVALELFAKLQQKSTLLFLQTYPTPQEAMAASREQIKEVLRQAKHSNPTLVATSIVEQVHQSHLQADAVTIRTKSRLTLALVSQLLPLIEQIAHYDKEIDTLF